MSTNLASDHSSLYLNTAKTTPQRSSTSRLSLVPKSALINRDPLSKLFFGKPARQHVREFGALLATVLIVMAGIGLFKSWSLANTFSLFITGCLMASLGYFAPRALYPVWDGWMTLAGLIGTVMTTILLSLLWCIVMIPTGIALKMLRIDTIDGSIDQSRSTYWETTKESRHDFKLLERQF